MAILGLAALVVVGDPLRPGGAWTEERVESLLAIAVAGRDDRSAIALERLRSAGPAAVPVLEKVFGRIAREAEVLGAILEGIAPGGPLRDTLWRAILGERLEEAARMYRAGNYERARALAEGIIAFDPPPRIRDRARVLRLRALGRRFRNEVLQADIVSPLRAFEEGDEAVLELVLRNLSNRPIDIFLDPAQPVLGSVSVESAAVVPGGGFRSIRRVDHLPLAEERIRIEPRGTWHRPLTVQPIERIPRAVVRLRVAAVLRPSECASGSERYSIPIEVPPVDVYFVPKGTARLAEDPLADLARAARDLDERAVFVSGAIAALEAESEEDRDRIIEILMTGLGAADRSGGIEAMGLLTLLTGERHGLDRRAWMLWYLGRGRGKSPPPDGRAGP
ncbi:MAG: hypothetical protein JXP34_20485 [Planctomycetes bacterium]|nr:hypothetical protein [Planctomycetota bacterium]